MAVRDSGYLSERRLQDILALIQILGFGAELDLTPNQICVLLQDVDGNRRPTEDRMKHWASVARAHREFFRVSGETPSISLAARFAAGNDPATRKLHPESVQRLMQTAIDIHDREAKRDERWTLYLPLIIAVIGAVGSVVTALVAILAARH